MVGILEILFSQECDEQFGQHALAFWGPHQQQEDKACVVGSHGVPWGCAVTLWVKLLLTKLLAIIGINSWLLWWYATSIHMLFTMVFTMLFTMVNTMVHRSAYMPFHVHCRLIWWDPRGVQLGRRRQHFERTKEDPNAEDPAMISTCTVRVPLFRSCECDCDILWPCQAMSNYVKSCQFMSNCHTVSLISIEIWISVGNLDEKCASSQAVFPESVSLSLRISRHLSQAHFILNLLISVEICWYLLILKCAKRGVDFSAGSSSSVATPNLARLLRSILAVNIDHQSAGYSSSLYLHKWIAMTHGESS